MVAQHLSQNLVRPSSGSQALAQTMKKTRILKHSDVGTHAQHKDVSMFQTCGSSNLNYRIIVCYFWKRRRRFSELNSVPLSKNCWPRQKLFHVTPTHVHLRNPSMLFIIRWSSFLLLKNPSVVTWYVLRRKQMFAVQTLNILFTLVNVTNILLHAFPFHRKCTRSSFLSWLVSLFTMHSHLVKLRKSSDFFWPRMHFLFTPP